jgi:NAD(P)H dehydrogenase (quinone)
MHGFAEDYGAALGRQVSYIPEEVDAWNETFVDRALAENPHVAEHLKTLTRLVAGGRYDVVTDQLGNLLGRRPKTVRWALENNPRIRKVAGKVAAA